MGFIFLIISIIIIIISVSIYLYISTKTIIQSFENKNFFSAIIMIVLGGISFKDIDKNIKHNKKIYKFFYFLSIILFILGILLFSIIKIFF
jgi:hypothetical protein